MNRCNSQGGMTLIGWLMTLVLVGALALTVLKVVPVYMEYFKVKQALHSVVEQSNIGQVTTREIYRQFMRQMDVEDVNRFTENNIHKHLEVQKKGPTVTLTIRYQTITVLIANISLLIDFEHQASNR